MAGLEPYAEQIQAARIAAEAHIRRCGAEPSNTQQSLLFSGDLFVGVRFSSGAAEARWRFGSPLVELLRDGKAVAKVPLHPAEEVRRAA